MLYEVCLKIGVCIDHLLQGFTQLVSISILHYHHVRNVVLCGVAVHFPIEEYAALILGDGIIVVLAFRPELAVIRRSCQSLLFTLGIDKGSHLVNGRILHHFLYCNLYSEGVESTHGESHGSQ